MINLLTWVSHATLLKRRSDAHLIQFTDGGDLRDREREPSRAIFGWWRPLPEPLSGTSISSSNQSNQKLPDAIIPP